MSSESGGRSVLAPMETKAQGLSKGSKIRYTGSCLLSFAKLSTEKGLLRGIEPSVLSEFELLDRRLDRPREASYNSDSERGHENLHKGLLSSESVGLLGPCSLLGVHGDIAVDSQPMVEENVAPRLHKCKEPYRPPDLFKADWNDYKDEVWVSPECVSENEGLKQSWIKDLPEAVNGGQKEAFQEKEKKTSSEHDMNVEVIMPLEISEYVLPINCHQSQALLCRQLDQCLTIRRKRISQGHRKSLRTKGTTAVFLLTANSIYLCVESRETLFMYGRTFITNELLKKYEVFWNRIFVVYTGDVPIGSDLLQYLREAVPKDRELSIDELAILAYQFHSKEDGLCEAWIGGLLADGTPSLIRLYIKSHTTYLDMEQNLNRFNKPIKYITGAGAEAAMEFLNSRVFETEQKKKEAVGGTMAMACAVDELTGGYASTINLYRKAEVFGCDITMNKTIKFLIENFNEVWVQKAGVFILYPHRSKQDYHYFNRWIRAMGHNYVLVHISSPIAKLKNKDLTFGYLDFKNEQLVKTVLTWGTVDTKVIRGFSIRKIEFEGMIFYVAQPTVDLMKKLKTERIDEYHELPNEDLVGRPGADNDDKLPDIDAEGWSFECIIPSHR